MFFVWKLNRILSVYAGDDCTRINQTVAEICGLGARTDGGQRLSQSGGPVDVYW